MRGSPDYGAYAAKTNIASVSDLGEAAVRLGSIVTYDRRGDVVWFDSFEDGLQAWVPTPVGVGSAVAIDNTAARSKGQSAKLTAGNAVGNITSLQSSRSLLTLGRHGLEASFSITDIDQNLSFLLDYFTGTVQITAVVIYSTTTGALQIRRNGGALVTLPLPFPLTASGPKFFHTGKLCADFITLKWARLMLDNYTFDLSQYPLWTTPSATYPELGITISQNNRAAGANPVMNLDDVILTQNEP